MKIHYNSPVILTFALVAAVVQGVNSATNGTFSQAFFATAPGMSLADPFTYFRLFSHVIGHASWEHLVGNFSIILLIGPLLEEKYGSKLMLWMLVATAFSTAVLNNFLFATGLYGASGIVFMLILLSSFANIKSGHIPLTFIIVVFLYLGKEIMNSLRPDQISQSAHIIGGVCGGIFGFVAQNALGKKLPQPTSPVNPMDMGI